MSEKRAPTPEKAAAERMIDALGSLSSHPKFLVRRLKWVWWISITPIFFVLVYFLWRAWGVISAVSDLDLSVVIPRVVDLIKDIFVVGPWFIVAYACSIAISFSALLTLRVAATPHHAARAWSGAGVAWSMAIVGCIACIGLCTLAAWASQTPHIAPANRWWIVLASLVPMYAVLAVVEVSEMVHSERKFSIVSILRWVLFAPAFVATLVLSIPASAEWLTTQFFSLLDWISAKADWPILEDIVEQLRLQQVEEIVTKVLGLFVAVAVMLLTSAHIRAVRRRLMKELDEKSQEEHEQPKKGCIGRILAWFGIGAAEPEAEETGEPELAKKPAESWFEALVEGGAAAGFSFAHTWHPGERLRHDRGRSSPPWEDDQYDWLFAGSRPSTDQVRLLRAFQQRWYEHITIVEQELYGADRESHADLLVEAEDGSGCGSAIAACAAFACVARGQRVMMIAENRSAQDAMVDGIRQRFEAFGFESLFEVAPLRADSVSAWCPPVTDPNASPPADPPDVMVATLDDYEQVFCAGAYSEQRLRGVQRSIEVVIVENVDRLINDEQVRLHLPFVLDKHRLLLRTENRAMQAVLTCRPLGRPPEPTDDEDRPVRPISSVARMRLASRFFGGDGGLDGRRDPTAEAEADERDPKRKAAHLCYLRRVAQDRAAALELLAAPVPVDSADAEAPPPSDAAVVEDATAWVVRRLLKDGVVLLSAGNRPEQVPAGFVDEEQAPALAGLKTWESDRGDARDAKWVVAIEPLTPKQLDEALRRVADLSGAALVVVSADEVGFSRQRRRRRSTFPVFPAPTSPALFVSHLRSAVGSLRPDVPIRREHFARFGLDWEAESDVLASRHAEAIPLEESWSLEIDRGLAHLLRREDEIWPAIFVRHQEGFAPHRVDFESPLDAGLVLVREGQHLRSARRSGRSDLLDRRRFATWMTRRGLELGRTDLAYFHPILHRGLRQSFRAIELVPGSDGTRIVAEPLSPDGGDLVLPVRRTRVSIPPDVALRSPQAIREVNAFVFGLHESSTACHAHERIVGLAPAVSEQTGLGVVKSVPIVPPIEFTLQVGVTILSIGGAFPIENAESALKSLYAGDWESSIAPGNAARDPWHGLARCIAFAIEKVAPSLLAYANAYAFRPPRGQDGATILFVEPMATQGTALEAITTILDDAALREHFLAAFKVAAELGLRATTGTRIEGDQAEVPAESRDELLAILELLKCTTTPPALEPPPSAVPRGGGAAVIEPPGFTSRLDQRPAPARSVPRIATSATLRWRDINAASESEWRSMGSDAISRSPEYGVLVDLSEEFVEAETAAFGHHDGLHPDDAEALRSACIRIERRISDPNTLLVSADYETMIERSIEPLREIAERTRSLADASGLVTTRERVGLFASLVQSIEYEAGRDGGGDGKSRLGVQMPVKTLFDRVGDCDSVSVLLASLLRAAGVARSGLVLIEEPGGGHMMVAVDCEAFAGDCRLAMGGDRYVLVEATNHFPLGHCDAKYHGRHVRMLALG